MEEGLERVYVGRFQEGDELRAERKQETERPRWKLEPLGVWVISFYFDRLRRGDLAVVSLLAG